MKQSTSERTSCEQRVLRQAVNSQDCCSASISAVIERAKDGSNGFSTEVVISQDCCCRFAKESTSEVTKAASNGFSARRLTPWIAAVRRCWKMVGGLLLSLSDQPESSIHYFPGIVHHSTHSY